MIDKGRTPSDVKRNPRQMVERRRGTVGVESAEWLHFLQGLIRLFL
jgi:hypothetical protein